jgi:hypothetical protein
LPITRAVGSIDRPGGGLRIGVAPAGATPILNPPPGRSIEPTARVIGNAADDTGNRHATGRPVIDEPRIREPVEPERRPERTLVLGWNRRGSHLIQEMDRYAEPGSEVLVVSAAAGAEPAIISLGGRLRSHRVRLLPADATSRETLDSLGLATFDHIVVLCESDDHTAARADARAMVTLLHLRDLVDRAGRHVPIVSELLDVRDRALAEVSRADDFIVSAELISLLIAQVAENRDMHAIFRELLDPEGSEIYLRPVGDYLVLGAPAPFAVLIEAARRRGETALGYRIASRIGERGTYGVRLNPPHTEPVEFVAGDRVVVLAER